MLLELESCGWRYPARVNRILYRNICPVGFCHCSFTQIWASGFAVTVASGACAFVPCACAVLYFVCCVVCCYCAFLGAFAGARLQVAGWSTATAIMIMILILILIKHRHFCFERHFDSHRSHVASSGLQLQTKPKIHVMLIDVIMQYPN